MDQQQYGRKLTVDSKTNCYVLPKPKGFNALKEIAAAAELMPGIHVIRINKGTFSFFEDGHEPQPYVLLWIEGGTFKNKASDMPVNFSWSCLNGYNDTCTIEVMQGGTTKLYALFIDCEGSDNVGQIELSILSQNDEVASDSLPDEVEETKFAKVTEYACAAGVASDETAKKVSGWYELNENEDGQFSFVLKAGNGEVILSSVLHGWKESAERGIASARKNCARDDRYEKKISDGKPCFDLTDDDGQIIGSSQSYSSEASCSKGMASVRKNGSSTVLKETAEV